MQARTPHYVTGAWTGSGSGNLMNVRSHEPIWPGAGILQRPPNTEVKPKANYVLKQIHEIKHAAANQGIFATPSHF